MLTDCALKASVVRLCAGYFGSENEKKKGLRLAEFNFCDLLQVREAV